MSILEGIGLQFRESMSGYIGVGQSDPLQGVMAGKKGKTGVRFTVQITIVDMHRFLDVGDHEAALSGEITFEPLGNKLPIYDGHFSLFTLDQATGIRQLVYAFKFKDKDGQPYYLHGQKKIHSDRCLLDLVEDMTWLFTIIYRGDNEKAPIYGAGEMYFKLRDAPSLLKSIKTVGDASILQKVAVRLAFFSFAYGILRDEYLKWILPFYDTRYENLVLSGIAQGDDGPRPFFLVSGEHDKGFPWGDGESFGDLILAIGDEHDGYERFCITDRVLPGLHLDVDRGSYTYHGPLFAIKNGYSASFLQMHNGAAHLVNCEADFKIQFKAHPYKTVPITLLSKLKRMLETHMIKELCEILPSKQPLGMYITPHRVEDISGQLHISIPEGSSTARKLSIDVSNAFGEAERSTFRNLKWPKLLYKYICALRLRSGVTRVRIHTGSLRRNRTHWVTNHLVAFLGAIRSRVASPEILMEGNNLSIKPLNRRLRTTANNDLFEKQGDPVIEVNNDHFPTAVFQRRIIRVRDPSGEQCLALEDDMTSMHLDPINSNNKVTVASVMNSQDKKAALDEVLNKTNFDDVLEKQLAATGKNKADFSIVIKPNFMFAYSVHDPTTFTDPELVAHLVQRLRARGFDRIAVVEAQSVYGEYFDKRSVREVAKYLGYDGAGAYGYQIIDLTEEILANPLDKQYLGEHLGVHPIPRTWRDADFRISFAKNKTHTYAYYTLTMKNVYGALPLANKFKEYHCKRDIYETTIEYLRAFPVHFGLVDAYVSADSPFGVLADPLPNMTLTIIGGADLVAVDWVAASKMGINPMISKYMQLAVKAFGKPEIDLVGDKRYQLYRPWLNQLPLVPFFAHKLMDGVPVIGNLFYVSCAEMDEKHFRFKHRALYMQILRRLTLAPIRRTLFVRTGKRPSWANRVVNRLFYWLGS